MSGAPDASSPHPARLRTALLISGGGRTALNLIACAERGELPIDVGVVLATRGDAPGVGRLEARVGDRGVKVHVVPRTPEDQLDSLHDRTDALLFDAGVELVCLCGWLRHFRVRGERADWRARVINIHPSLLPEFGGPGMHGDHVHAAVLAAGRSESGCTVHYVDELYDHGPIILQRRVPVLPGDDVPTLAARVFEAELLAYPEAIRRHAAGVPAETRAAT